MDKIISTIKIRDYTTTPGGRDKPDGDFSGEWFYVEHLQPAFDAASKMDGKLEIDMNGVYGYSTSWLNGVFERLINEYGMSSWDKLVITARLPKTRARVRHQFFPEEKAKLAKV